MIYIIVLLSAIITGGVIASGGGGSSSKDSPPYSSYAAINSSWNSDFNQSLVNKYQTSEYKNQWGLEDIKAAEAYALLEQNNKAIAGDGVKVGIADSGVRLTHQDITTNANPGFSSPSADDSGHGTHVASTAAGVGGNGNIHGVAFNAQIISVKVVQGETPADDDGYGIAWSANAGAKVVNMSFGVVDDLNPEKGLISEIGDTNYNFYKLSIADEFRLARNKDVFIAAAAGNDGYEEHVSLPALFAQDAVSGGNMVAVAAIDQKNNIANFSNRCKQVKDFCLVAPGVDIVGAWNYNDSAYAIASGTSMATPHVSGAAAVLRGAWPHLTAAQVTQILLKTATDLGAKGIDDVYGHGLLNLEAAVQAQGKNNIVANGYVNGSGYDARVTKLITSTIFGDAYQNNVIPILKRAVFFDDFGRDYKADLDQKILSPKSGRYNLDNYLFNHYNFKEVPVYLGRGGSFKLGFSTDFSEGNFGADSKIDSLGLRYRTHDNSRDDPNKNSLGTLSFSYRNNLSSKLKIGMVVNGRNPDPDEDSLINQFSFIANSSFLPYHSSQDSRWLNNNSSGLALSNSSQFFVSNNLSKNWSLDFSYSAYNQGNLAFSNLTHANSKIVDGVLTYKVSDSFKLGFSYGSLREASNSFLGSISQGAFSSNNKPSTNYFRINGDRKIVPGLYLLASYSEGKTVIAGNDLGVFRNFSDLRSRAFSFGLLTDKFFSSKLGFVYSEPLRVYKGLVDLDLPLSRDLIGNVNRLAVNNLSLKPSGQEKDLEVFYQKILSSQASVGFNFLVRQQPDNIKNSHTEYLWFGKYVLKF